MAAAARAAGVLLFSSTCGGMFQLRGSLCGTRPEALAFRAEQESQAQWQAELPWPLWPGTQAHLLRWWSQYLRCKCVHITHGTGVWVPLQWFVFKGVKRGQDAAAAKPRDNRAQRCPNWGGRDGAQSNSCTVWWQRVKVPTEDPGGGAQSSSFMVPWWQSSRCIDPNSLRPQGEGHSTEAALIPTGGEALWHPNPREWGPAATWVPESRSHHSESSSTGKETLGKDPGQLHHLGSGLVKTVNVLGSKGCRGPWWWQGLLRSSCSSFPMGWNPSEGIFLQTFKSVSLHLKLTPVGRHHVVRWSLLWSICGALHHFLYIWVTIYCFPSDLKNSFSISCSTHLLATKTCFLKMSLFQLHFKDIFLLDIDLWLKGFFFGHFEYAIPMLTGFHSFWWSVINDLIIFLYVVFLTSCHLSPGAFKNFFLSLDSWVAVIMMCQGVYLFAFILLWGH